MQKRKWMTKGKDFQRTKSGKRGRKGIGTKISRPKNSQEED